MRHEPFYTEFIHDVIHRRICRICLFAKSFSELSLFTSQIESQEPLADDLDVLTVFERKYKGIPDTVSKERPSDPIYEHIQVNASSSRLNFKRNPLPSYPQLYNSGSKIRIIDNGTDLVSYKMKQGEGFAKKSVERSNISKNYCLGRFQNELFNLKICFGLYTVNRISCLTKYKLQYFG